jgi:predicted enzyme related to lactoylglutathione lyase
MSVRGKSVVWLPVTDVDASADFYCRRLGLEERRRDPEWAELDANGLRIGLNGRPTEAPGEGGAVIAFQSANGLEDEVSRLSEQGVQFVGGISEHPWGRVASFKDPDGNDLQLYEPPH